MDEKKLTVRGLAKQVGIGRMTLERILDGRYATHDELERIASGLEISVERLKQKDTHQKAMELDELLQSRRNTWRALQLAQELTEVAIGRSERIDTFGRLGRALSDLNRCEEAHEVFQQVYEWAVKSDDVERVMIASNNFGRSCYKRKEFDSLRKMLDEVESRASGYLEYVGRINHFRGMCAYADGDLMNARVYYLKSYDVYIKIGDLPLIGRMQVNLANLEFHAERYLASKKLFEQARVNLLHDDQEVRAVADKYLARTLLVLGETDRALELIEEQLELYRTHDWNKPELLAGFLMMKAEAKADVVSAENILTIKSVSREMKCSAADFLTTLYMKRGDSELAYKYFLLMKEFLPDKFINYKRSVWF